MSKVVIELNSYNNTWDVGWRADDGDFAPYLCGYATKEEAEAQIPGFDERVERELQAYAVEREAEEREQNERWPNLGYVRQQIKKLHERGQILQAFDASDKLAALLDMDRHEHITWPLPPWKAIKNRTF